MPSHSHDEPPLQIKEDFAFQLRMHRLQVIGLWSLFALLVVSFLGLGGGGILSSASARDPSGRIEVHYERFTRMTARQALQIELHGDESVKTFELMLGGEFVRDVQIDSVYPEPDRQSSAQDGLRFEIDADPPGFALLIIRYRPLHPGVMQGSLGVGGSLVPFRQFVYP